MRMNSIRVGYLPMYIKLYDDSNPRYRDPMVCYMHELIDELRCRGIEVVLADEVCRVREEFERATAKFNAEGVDAVITQHLAYSPSLESAEALLKLDAPIVVFDTTPDYGLISAAATENRIGANHGIHGVQDMCQLLLRNGRPYFLCVGHASQEGVLDELVGLCRAAATAAAFRRIRVGSVGGAFPGMGDFLISDERYARDIGAIVEYMTPDVVRDCLAKVTDKEIECEIERDRREYDVEVTFEHEYREATRSGLAVRRWMEALELDACTVNFLTLDQCGLPKMPFVECCKIMGRGKGYAGEGDVLTAGLVGALIQHYPDTTFTEMFCPDWERDIILLSHMGESNPRLAQWKPVLTDMKFNYNSCGNTVAMYNCYRPGRAVLVNLSPLNDHFNLIITEGEIVPEGLEHGAYRYATQGWFHPCKPLRSFLKEYSLYGGTHHSALIYAADIAEIRSFGEMMGFRVLEIK